MPIGGKALAFLFFYERLIVKFEKVKIHFRENKEIYIGMGCGITIAGFTCFIMRGRHANVPRVLDGQDTVTMRPLSFLNNHSNLTNNVVNVIEREGRGHPGYLVRCLETGDIFTSQNEAADFMKVTKSIMSGHLQNKLSDVNGYHFIRMTPNITEALQKSA